MFNRQINNMVMIMTMVVAGMVQATGINWTATGIQAVFGGGIGTSGSGFAFTGTAASREAVIASLVHGGAAEFDAYRSGLVNSQTAPALSIGANAHVALGGVALAGTPLANGLSSIGGTGGYGGSAPANSFQPGVQESVFFVVFDNVNWTQASFFTVSALNTKTVSAIGYTTYSTAWANWGGTGVVGTWYAPLSDIYPSVTFDAQGGTTPIPTQIIVMFGSEYGTLATTTRSGFTFAGWYLDAACTGTLVTNATTVSIASDHTLFAKWTELVTSTTPIPVPYTWLNQYPVLLGLAGGDYEAAALADEDGDGHKAWQEYITGSAPTNSESVFSALITMSNGLPRLIWTPDLGTSRVYLIEGCTNLINDVWGPTNAGSRFYRVKVQMPQ